MDLNKIKWESFKKEVSVWEHTYEIISRIAKTGHIVGLFVLKHHIQLGKIKFCAGEQEKTDYFMKILNEMQAKYDPDIDIDRLKGMIVCLKLNAKSHLFMKFGKKEICGKYLGMSEIKVFTKIKNLTGSYQEEECNLVIEMAYPGPKDIITLCYLDIEIMESFLK